MSTPANSLAPPNTLTHNRTIVLCVLASLALHALVLLLFPELREGPPQANPIMVLTAKFAPRVAFPEALPPLPKAKAELPPEPAQPVAEVPKPALPKQVLPKPAPPKETARRPAVSPAARRTEPPRPMDPVPLADGIPAAAAPRSPDTPGAPTPAAATAVTAPSAIPPAATAVRLPEAQAAAARDAPARSSSVADPGSLDRYRLALIGAARRYKRYPAQAMERGWQGRVEIALVIGSNGMIQSTAIRASSGYEILDNQALDMVKKAKPLAPIPAALRGREFTVVIPVIFDLQSG